MLHFYDQYISETTSHTEEKVNWHFIRLIYQSSCFYKWIMIIRFIKLDEELYFQWILKELSKLLFELGVEKEVSIKTPAKEMACLE